MTDTAKHHTIPGHTIVVSLSRRPLAALGAGLLAVVTLAAIAMRGSTQLPWSASRWIGRMVERLSVSSMLVGGILVGLVLLGGLRLALAHRKGDPESPQHVATPTSLPWWQGPVWAVAALCLLTLPLAVLWWLRHADTTVPVPPDAVPVVGSTGPTAGGVVPASPQARPGQPAESSLWSFLLVLGVVALVLVAFWGLHRIRTSSRQGPTEVFGQPTTGSQRGAITPLSGGIPNDPRDAVLACYLEMERALAERGIPRRPGETPTDLVRRAQFPGPLASQAGRQLCVLCDEARFSDHPLEQISRDEAIAMLRQVRDAMEPR